LDKIMLPATTKNHSKVIASTAEVDLSKPVNEAAKEREVIIDARAVCMRFGKAEPTLRNLTFEVERGATHMNILRLGPLKC
jgi:hypothetical protein